MKPNENTDVLAIVKESSEIQELTSKSQKQVIVLEKKVFSNKTLAQKTRTRCL